MISKHRVKKVGNFMEKIFARVLIKDKQHNFLVIQDREGEWNLPGGKLEKGETPVQCAIREVKEEIGLQVDQLTEIFQGEFTFGKIKWQGYFYFAEVVVGLPAINELDKIRGILFVPSFDSVKFAPQLSDVIKLMAEDPFIQMKTPTWN